MTSDEGTTTLSNGRVVEFPVAYEAAIAGVVAVADFDTLDRVTPERLRPVRVGRRAGLLTLVGIDYARVGDFDPYGEFAVIVPVSRHSIDGVPLSARTVGGWVHWLPVTTDPARLLGVDGWGYPKTVAGIEFETGTGDPERRTGSADRPTRCCRVAVGGEAVLTLTVDTGRTLPVDTSATSYTEHDGGLLATAVELAGPVGARSLDSGVHLTLGRHDRADDLRDLGVGRRLLGRQIVGSFWGRGVSGVIHRGRRV
ncbi:acetoacetate decarboxylase family protein [Salinirubrum litoreum]|uniref:Acetoacetate decarboxylase family protein n=1 Tax=Salinirubrum litoreum TaxID=1126234 RepID=A0ABD5R7T9_9EURY